MNYGAHTEVTSYYAGTHGLFYWDLSAYAGATINKAQLRVKATNGNTTGLWYAGVKTAAWAEGNKTGNYPGADPAAPGVTWNHPNGLYTGPSGTFGWGSSADAAFSDVADTGDVYTHYAFSSEPTGIAFLVADVTALVQDWVSGTKPNYGLVTWTGNHGLYASEAGTADQPVLFLDYGTQAASNVVTIPAGQLSVSIPITILQDTANEDDETIQVTLSNASGATLGANAVHTYTIVDDESDLPLVQFQTTSSGGSEATRQASLTVTLSASSTSDVTVDYIASGTAVQDTDYIFGAADTVALKRSAGLTAGGVLDARFASLTSDNVVTTTVRDARLYDQGNGRYMNYGTATTVASYYAGTHSLWWWDLANYDGAMIAKAELRLSGINGNTTGLWYAGVKTWAWAEGNKTGNYPGADPAAPGVCWMHPNGTYTNASGTGGWGSAANAAFSNTADTGDVYTHYSFSSEPTGIAYLVADVTALVQDWVSGTKSNYGVYAWTGNHGLDTSEGTADKQPVLFVDYAQPVTIQRVTIPAGQLSASVPLGVTDDAAVEGAETVVVTLNNPAGGVLGTNTVHTYTITDND
jgi:hypothetical protein